MTDTRQAPAGWYTDPTTGQPRWWDGTAWGPTAPPITATPNKGRGAAITSLTLGLVALVLTITAWAGIATILAIIGIAFGIIGAAASRDIRTNRGMYIAALITNALALSAPFWLWVLFG